MEWLNQNWLAVVGAVLVLLLVLRLVIGFLPARERPRHTGERTIRVIGVGGAGGNAVNEMIRARLGGVEYVAVNTDAQVLEESLAPKRVRIGDQVTQGLGAGGDAAVGRRAAEEDADAIRASVEGADLVFVAAGLGGGTGSGAGPLIAASARAAGALTVGVVTLPFGFEGTTRRAVAVTAATELRESVDTLLVIENDRVNDLIADDTPLLEAFRVVNDVLGQTIRAVVDIMTVPGLINLDFADVRAIMQSGGAGLTGIGRASGDDRAVRAAQVAISSPLLDLDIRGAGGILLNVAGTSRLTLREVVSAAEAVREAADPGANLIFGATFEDKLRDEIRVTVIATRFRDEGTREADAAVPIPEPPIRHATTPTVAPARSRATTAPAPAAPPAAPAPAVPAPARSAAPGPATAPGPAVAAPAASAPAPAARSAATRPNRVSVPEPAVPVKPSPRKRVPPASDVSLLGQLAAVVRPRKRTRTPSDETKDGQPEG